MRSLSVAGLLFTLHLVAGCVSAESRMETGNELFERRNYSAALEQYRAARKKDPALVGIDERIHETEVRLWLQTGDEAVDKADWDAAERAWSEVRRLDSDNEEVERHEARMREKRANGHFHAGQQLLGRGNPFDAIAEFEQALIYQPRHPRAQRSLEQALGEKKERESQAESAFRQGMQSLAQERMEEAIHHFSTTMNLNPHHPGGQRELENTKLRLAEALVFEGDAALARKQWVQAKEFYRKARTHNASLPGLAQKIRTAEREDRAAKLIARADKDFERGNWRGAWDQYSRARELTNEPGRFVERLEASRENLAREVYGVAQRAERAGDFEEALAKYRSISEFYADYRDVRDRSEKIDVALRTAKRAYESGVHAQDESNLREAREQFRICAELVPGFRDVAVRRRQVEDAFRRAETIYSRALQAESRADYERAKVLYEECLTIARPLRDARSRLDRVNDVLVERADLTERYNEAVAAYDANDLERAKRLFEACARTQPGYQDVDERLSTLETLLATATNLYERAVSSEQSGQLDRASTLYDECLAVASPFQDAAERSKNVAFALEQLTLGRSLEGEKRLFDARDKYQLVLDRYPDHSEARGRAQKLDDTLHQAKVAYEALLEAQRKGNFDLALTYAEQIRERCVGFRDVDTRVDTLACEVEYERGVDAEQNEIWDEAITAFESCAARNPTFRDVRQRLRECRQKISATAPSLDD